VMELLLIETWHDLTIRGMERPWRMNMKLKNPQRPPLSSPTTWKSVKAYPKVTSYLGFHLYAKYELFSIIFVKGKSKGLFSP
jgi:hypothetical protein